MRRYYLTLAVILAILFAFFLASPPVQAGNLPEAAPAATASAVPPAQPQVVISDEFVQRTVLCTVSVFSEPDLNFATKDRVLIGQRWYINLTPVKGVDGRTWNEIFVSGPYNGFIPASCVAKY